MAAPPPLKKIKVKMDKEKPIYIDRNGNLKLLVGSGVVPMQVDANALRRASKVFDSMLFGPFIESNQTEDWTVKLPEDDPEALRIIFHAVHGNFRNMPKDLTTSKLYDITVMADKYAMIDSLEPWKKSWTSEMDIDPWQLEDKKETSYYDLKELLVLYHLGTSRQFSEALSVLVLKSKTNKNGQLLFKVTAGVDGEDSGPQAAWDGVGLLSGQIIAFARNVRSKSISRLLGGLNALFAFYTSETDNLDIECNCRSAALGLMIRHLVQKGLWPLPNTDDVHLSVAELSSIANKIRAGIISQPFKTCGPRGKTHPSRCHSDLPPMTEIIEDIEICEDAHVEFSQHFSTREARVSNY